MTKKIRLVFIGTGSAAPFNLKRMPCIALKYLHDLLVFDIGECCQYGLLEKRLKPVKSNLVILITHFHADHVAGIPTFLHTLKMSNRQKEIIIVGPSGLRQFITGIFSIYQLEKVPFPVKLLEVNSINNKTKIIENENYEIFAFPTKHHIPSIGYIFKEKDRKLFDEKKAELLGIPRTKVRKHLLDGKEIRLEDGRLIKPEDVIKGVKKGVTIGYTGDTKFFPDLIKFLEGVDILISEATYLEKTEKAEAEERFHLTAKQAASIAKEIKAKKLILTHISSRYKDLTVILDEAKSISGKFNVIIPNDGDELYL